MRYLLFRWEQFFTLDLQTSFGGERGEKYLIARIFTRKSFISCRISLPLRDQTLNMTAIFGPSLASSTYCFQKEHSDLNFWLFNPYTLSAAVTLYVSPLRKKVYSFKHLFWLSFSHLYSRALICLFSCRARFQTSI